jgi:integrase
LGFESPVTHPSEPLLTRGFVLSPAEELRDLTIADIWDRYTNYKRPQLSPSTIAKDYNHGLIEFMFRTGCRPGEVTALQWGDIDRDFKTITFERTLVLSDDGLVIKQGLKTQ